MVGEEPAADGDELGGVVREVGEAVGGLYDELRVVTRVAGERPQSLERQHVGYGPVGPGGSFGRPRTRSPTMLRMTSSVPPATRAPGTPRTNSAQA